MTNRDTFDNKTTTSEIEELKQRLATAEAKLEELTDLNRMCESFKVVAQNTSNSVVIVDREGLAIWVNPSFEKLSGVTADEIVGRTTGDFLNGPGTDLATVQSIWNQMQLQQNFTYEIQHYTKDGTAYQIIVNGEPIFDKDGVWFGYAMIETDITLLKIMEQALVNAHHSAEAKENAKINFLANLSHELRTPLNGILGLSDLLAMTDPTDEQQEYLESIQESAVGLNHLIDNLLDLTIKPKSKELDSYDSINLREKLDSFSTRYESESEKKGIAFHLIVDPEIPDNVCMPWVDFAKVAAHLCDNAVKFTEEGQIDFRVKRDGEDFMCVEIEDTGIGIDENIQPYIYDEYYQGDESHTRTYGGIGLGLTLAKKFAKRFKSQINLTTEPEKGSCFSFRVPYLVTHTKS